MPKYLFVFFFFIGSNLYAQVFSSTEIHADLAVLKEKIEEIHPNPYKFVTPARFQQVYDSLYRFDKPLTVKQTFSHFLNLTKTIRCGHTSILLDERLIPPSNLNPKFLPIDVVIFDERVYVSRNFSDNKELTKGTEIVAIEEIPMDKLLRYLSKYAFQNGDGENHEAEMYYVQRNFRRLLYLFLDEQNELHLRIKPQNKTENSVSVRTISIANLREIEAERFPVRNNDTYKNVALSQVDSLTSLVRIRSFDGNEYEDGDFKQEILEIFREISQKQTKNLIIDLRNNAGGRLDYADEVLKYLLAKPYQRYQISSNQSIREKKKAYTINRFYEATNPYLFGGNLFVLINEGTFSAAVYLATHLRSQQVGTFVGTTCGGAADGSSAGEFASVTLPNTNFTINLPLLRINYNATKTPQLTPDHTVRQSLTDFLQGEDSIYNYAKNLIIK